MLKENWGDGNIRYIMENINRDEFERMKYEWFFFFFVPSPFVAVGNFLQALLQFWHPFTQKHSVRLLYFHHIFATFIMAYEY